MTDLLAQLFFLVTAVGFPPWLIRRSNSYSTVAFASCLSLALCYGSLAAGGLYASADPEYDGLGAGLVIFCGWIPAVLWVGMLTALKIAAIRGVKIRKSNEDAD